MSISALGITATGRTNDLMVGHLNSRPQNRFALWALLVLFALVPLPFASARPFLWTIWAVYAGLVATIFFAWHLRSSTPLRVTLRHHPVPASLLSLSFVMLLVQLVPLGTVPIMADGAQVLAAPQISVAPGQTVLMLLRQLTYALVGVLVMQLAISDKRRPVLLHGLIAITLAYAAYGLIALRMGDTILGLPKWAYFGVVTGSFVNRNSFSTFLGFGAILALAHGCAVLKRQAERHRDDGWINGLRSNIILYGAAYAFLMLVVIGTQSRAGLFSALTGSSVVVLAALLAIRRLGLLLILVPLGLALLTALLWQFGGGLLERIEWQGFGSDSRPLLYQQVMDLIALRPWTGFGGGTFGVAFPIVHQLPLSPDLSWNMAHNTYLTLWAELGLIAGSLPILAVAFIALRLVQAIARGTGSWTAQIAALAVIVQVAIHSTVDFSLEIPANTVVFIAIVASGLATVTSRSIRQTSPH